MNKIYFYFLFKYLQVRAKNKVSCKEFGHISIYHQFIICYPITERRSSPNRSNVPWMCNCYNYSLHIFTPSREALFTILSIQIFDQIPEQLTLYLLTALFQEFADQGYGP